MPDYKKFFEYWHDLYGTGLKIAGWHLKLHGKSCNKIQDMLWKERNINWNDFPTDCKRGSCCIKTRVTEVVPVLNGDATVEVHRSRWVVDREPPVFTQNREYVERRL